MAGLYKAFKASPLAAVGISLPISEGINQDGTIPTFKLAYIGRSNKAYGACIATAMKPHQKLIAANLFSKEDEEKMMLGVFVDSILKGWENICDEYGQPIPYSKEKALEMMTDLPELYEKLFAYASDFSNYTEAAVGAIEKN